MSGIPCLGCGHPDAAVRSNGLTGVTYTDCDVCRGAYAIPRRVATEADAVDRAQHRKALNGSATYFRLLPQLLARDAA